MSPGAVPRLHAITAGELLDRPGFVELAGEVLRAGGAGLALHLRAHGRPGGGLFELASRLAAVAGAAGAWLIVNDRVDVALALESAAGAARGVQIGARGLPLTAVRALLPRRLALGYSAHGASEAVSAAADGADWLLLGTIYATPSHPGRVGSGVALVAETAARLGGTAPPVIAIGGVTPGRVPELRAAGAYGVAVLSGIWGASDPVAALEPYLAALREVERRG